jgi:hypothetical protein
VANKNATVQAGDGIALQDAIDRAPADRPSGATVNGKDYLLVPVNKDGSPRLGPETDDRFQYSDGEDEVVQGALVDFAQHPNNTLRYAMRWNDGFRDRFAMVSANPADFEDEEDAAQYLMYRMGLPFDVTVKFERLDDAAIAALLRQVGN